MTRVDLQRVQQALDPNTACIFSPQNVWSKVFLSNTCQCASACSCSQAFSQRFGADNKKIPNLSQDLQTRCERCIKWPRSEKVKILSHILRDHQGTRSVHLELLEVLEELCTETNADFSEEDSEISPVKC
jgi:hypothetical protein